GLHELGHLHKGATVFLCRWRIHDDARPAIGAVHPEVASKARVGRRQAQGVRLQSVANHHRVEPGQEQRLALRIGPGHRVLGRRMGSQ
ncbi:hypothetical protein RZS08_02445, partial [Arthrospira platensis SPKY1]|nr:hypothetical protein [Arthrospira platensis SPKY1]